MSFTVRKAEPHEAHPLAQFAEACFRESFGYLFPEEALDILCSKAFTTPVMEALILQGAWVAEGADGWRGYAALSLAPCPTGDLPSPHLELSRLYVASPWMGQGVSDALMTAFMDFARAKGMKGVWLEAFEGNPRALRFYQRWGFRDLGASVKIREGLHLPHRILVSDLNVAIQ
jgi:GNAT superfamily N-acetyltransferase